MEPNSFKPANNVSIVVPQNGVITWDKQHSKTINSGKVTNVLSMTKTKKWLKHIRMPSIAELHTPENIQTWSWQTRKCSGNIIIVAVPNTTGYMHRLVNDNFNLFLVDTAMYMASLAAAMYIAYNLGIVPHSIFAAVLVLYATLGMITFSSMIAIERYSYPQLNIVQVLEEKQANLMVNQMNNAKSRILQKGSHIQKDRFVKEYVNLITDPHID